MNDLVRQLWSAAEYASRAAERLRMYWNQYSERERYEVAQRCFLHITTAQESVMTLLNHRVLEEHSCLDGDAI